MTLQGMTDEMFQEIVQATEEIQFLIVKAGGMATKSKVEDALMKRYQFARSDAHSFTNFVEGNFSRRSCAWQILQRGATWQAKRNEPQASDYPEIS